MKFTTLDALSNCLNSTVRESLLNLHHETHKKLDIAWLTWQLDWLYSHEDILSTHLKTELQSYWCGVEELSTLADQVRYRWIADVGFSWQNQKVNKSTQSSPHRLLNILREVSPEVQLPMEHMKRFLCSFAGLPMQEWTRIEGWMTAPEIHPEPKPAAGLRVVENYHWLSREELLRVLSQRPVGEQLIESGRLNLIPLPERMPRPASFSLPDESLWLAWPQQSRPTHLHPIVQASLVCHEAAHLVQALKTTSDTQTDQDSMWQSESLALREEWDALHSFCISQPQKLQNIFARSWYEENFLYQRETFCTELNTFSQTEQCTKSAPSEQIISLPFLSSVYACIAESIYEEK